MLAKADRTNRTITELKRTTRMAWRISGAYRAIMRAQKPMDSKIPQRRVFQGRRKTSSMKVRAGGAGGGAIEAPKTEKSGKGARLTPSCGVRWAVTVGTFA